MPYSRNRAIAGGAAFFCAIALVTGAALELRSQQGATQPTTADAATMCGGCHRVPPPDVLPKHAWRDEFVRMMFIRENRVPPLGPPQSVYKSVQLPADMEQLLTAYVAAAPERLPTPDAWPDVVAGQFERRQFSVSEIAGAPAVSNVKVIDVDGDGRLDLIGTDMRQGLVFMGRPQDAGGALTVTASVPYPSHVTVADVDRDGAPDLLVGEMGEFLPADHDKGAVIWLRGLGKGKFGAFWLDGWPRVADVQAADYNGDGKPDLAVAAFGWRKTGQVAVLENQTAEASRPSFKTHTVDRRAGAIHTVPIDLNRDGKMDIVSLLAQEHESVVAYINKGSNDFSFEQKIVYAAPHPNWGSSNMQLVDLDKDGDVDVLLAHGDTWDDGLVKPYHGIQWLENTGTFPFVEHAVAPMAGVHAARAGDIDGDGDLDIVACALLAGGADVDEKGLPAVVWLEQIKPGTFARHTIEMGFPRHATLDLGDVDGDGDLDIAVGNFTLGTGAPNASVDLWINQIRKK